MLEELLNSRVNMLAEAARVGLDELSTEVNNAMERMAETNRVGLEELRAETNSLVGGLGDTFQIKLQVLEDTILAVNSTAQELSEKTTQELEGHREGSDPWSDWDLLECPDFIELRKRVDDMACGTAPGPQAHSPPTHKQVADVLERIAESQPTLSDDLRRRLVVFEDLLRIDDRGLQRLLREIDKNHLKIALRGAERELVEHFMNNLSSRAAADLDDELKTGERIPKAEIEAARAAIIDAAMEQRNKGNLVLPIGADAELV